MRTKLQTPASNQVKARQRGVLSVLKSWVDKTYWVKTTSRTGILSALFLAASPALATPGTGWQATLNGHFHDVAGVVTVVDEDTFRIDDFVYDGAGLDVRFYFGTENTTAAFSAGFGAGPQLVGPSFDGDTLVIDLPPGRTFDGYNAVSVWCVDVDVSFGDAVFLNPLGLPGDFNVDGEVNAADYTLWRDGDSAADANLDGSIARSDYAAWAVTFGTAAAATAIPEPDGLVSAGLLLAAATGLGRRLTV